MSLSEEAKHDLKLYLEQGLLNPKIKPFFLGIDLLRLVYSQHNFGGNRLPEFCFISRIVLDCFATALISGPDMDLRSDPVIVRCRLGEENGNLTLYLAAMVFKAQQILPVEMTTKSELWVAYYLRPLARV